MFAALHIVNAPPVAAASTPAAIAALQSPAVAAVLRERIEQVDRHGYDAAHDALHDEAEIAQGALAYLCAGLALEVGDSFAGEDAARAAAHLDGATAIWPWQAELFRPTDYATCLVKAAAMLIAEADRAIMAKGLLDMVRA